MTRAVEMEIDARALTARWAALRAGKGTLARFEQLATIETEYKEDSTPVTIADRECEEFLRSTLRAAFPGDGFLGEEYGSEPSSSGFTWIIDPIDATMNFVRGIPLFATLIGLEHQGDIVAGFCYIPALDRLYHSVKGKGAFRNDQPIRVSTIDSLAKSQLIYSSAEWFDRAHSIEFFLEAVRGAGRTRGFGDFYGFALVAEGGAEAMMEPGVQPWDVACFKSIIEEAGGVYSDWEGRPRIDGGGALVGNPAIHRQLLELYRKTRG